jgi:hypothetical protein
MTIYGAPNAELALNIALSPSRPVIRDNRPHQLPSPAPVPPRSVTRSLPVVVAVLFITFPIMHDKQGCLVQLAKRWPFPWASSIPPTPTWMTMTLRSWYNPILPFLVTVTNTYHLICALARMHAGINMLEPSLFST